MVVMSASAEARARAAAGLLGPERRNPLLSILPWALAVAGLTYGALSGSPPDLARSRALDSGAPSVGGSVRGAEYAPVTTGMGGVAGWGRAGEEAGAVGTGEAPASTRPAKIIIPRPKPVKTIIIEEIIEEEEYTTTAEEGEEEGTETETETETETVETESASKPVAGAGAGAVTQPNPPASVADDIPQTRPGPVAGLACKRCFRHGEKMATRRCLPAACPVFPATGRNVISTSLYGGDIRYTGGAIRNAEIASIIFPGWELRFYVKDDVPPQVLSEMRELGAQVTVITGDDVGFGMNWRFLVADDAAVDAFICRDADSRVSLRDRYAVDEWVKEGKAFHVVRDHPSHATLQVMGGTWGARRRVFDSIGTLRTILAGYIARTKDGHGYMADINFLQAELWPKMVESGLTQHDSYSCEPHRHGNVAGKPFPRKRAGVEHVGAVYNFNERVLEQPRQGDLDILIRDREPANCQPKGQLTGQERPEWDFADLAGAAETVEWGRMAHDTTVCTKGPASAAAGSAAPCVARWSQSKGVCAAAAAKRGGGSGRCSPALARWTDAFVDHEKANAGNPYTAVWDYEHALVVGPPAGRAKGAKDGVWIPQYDERMPYELEPIQALDGGVRYYSSLLVVSAAYGPNRVRESDPAELAALALEDIPRLLQATPPETIVLLPAALAAAVDSRIQQAARDGHMDATVADEIRTHIVAQEGSPVIYYARHVFVHECECA